MSQALVLFDLNKVLLHRHFVPISDEAFNVVSKSENLSSYSQLGNFQKYISPNLITIRPYINELLIDKLRKLNFSIGIFTSCKSYNAQSLTNMVINGPVECVLDDNHCQVDANKWPTLKDLCMLWKQNKQWNCHNTIIIDDSIHKVRYHPQNAIVVKEFDPLEEKFNLSDTMMFYNNLFNEIVSRIAKLHNEYTCQILYENCVNSKENTNICKKCYDLLENQKQINKTNETYVIDVNYCLPGHILLAPPTPPTQNFPEETQEQEQEQEQEKEEETQIMEVKQKKKVLVVSQYNLRSSNRKRQYYCSICGYYHN